MQRESLPLIRANANLAALSIGMLCAMDVLPIEAVAEGEAPRMRRFSMVLNGGTPFSQWWLPHPVVLDMKGGSWPADQSVPALRDHRTDLILGQTDQIRASEQEGLIVAGVFNGIDEHVEPIVKLADRKFKWRASVGARATKPLEFVAAGQTATVNGRQVQGPVYITRAWALVEATVTTIGAESNSYMSVAATAPQGASMNFEQWLRAQGLDPATITPAQRTTLQAQYDGVVLAMGGTAPPGPATPAPAPIAGSVPAPAPAPQPDDFIARRRQLEAAEDERIAAIRAACNGRHTTIQAQAIREGWDMNRVNLEVLRAERTEAPGGIVRHTMDAGRMAAVLTASLCMTGGMTERAVAAYHDAPTMEAALSREWRGASIHTLMHETIRAAGGWARAGRTDDDTIIAAFQADHQLRAMHGMPSIQGSSGFSSMSLSGVLGTSAYRKMLEAYQLVERIAHLICQETDATDFKTFTRIRLVDGGNFEKVGPGGELKHGTMSEQSFDNKVDTWGRILTLTREMMINDDLGAFLQLPTMIGRNGAIAVEQLVFEILLAGLANGFFHADNKNYISGATTVLGKDSFSALEQKMLDQTGSNGKPILIAPKILLTGTALANDARLLMTDDKLNESTTADKGKPSKNPHVGKCTPLKSPFINAQGLANSSATAWFLLAAAADVAAIQIAYLRGQRTPTVQTGEASFNTLGMSFRGFFDFGCKLQDPRGAAASKGAV